MPKQATQVKLSEKGRYELEHFVKRHRSEQHVLLARIVLSAGHCNSNVQIARELTITGDTVGWWRDRWGTLQGIPFDTPSSSFNPRCIKQEMR